MAQTISYKLFNKVFSPGTDPALDEVNLKGTHYEPYAEQIVECIKFLRGLEWKAINMDGFDGAHLVAYQYDVGSDNTLVICHGYRSHYFGNTSCAAKFFIEKGYNVIQIVSRGHEKSGGSYISFGEHEAKDLLLWLDKLEKELKISRMVLYGVSLGSNTVMRASEFIRSKAVKAMILDCGFTNTRKTLLTQIKHKSKIAFFGEVMMVVGIPFVNGMRSVAKKVGGFDINSGDTAEAIAKSTVPAFFIHGRKDRTVPIANTIVNYKACPNKKELYIAEEAEHGAGFVAGGENLQKKLSKFLAECGMQ